MTNEITAAQVQSLIADVHALKEDVRRQNDKINELAATDKARDQRDIRIDQTLVSLADGIKSLTDLHHEEARETKKQLTWVTRLFISAFVTGAVAWLVTGVLNAIP